MHAIKSKIYLNKKNIPNKKPVRTIKCKYFVHFLNNYLFKKTLYLTPVVFNKKPDLMCCKSQDQTCTNLNLSYRRINLIPLLNPVLVIACRDNYNEGIKH